MGVQVFLGPYTHIERSCPMNVLAHICTMILFHKDPILLIIVVVKNSSSLIYHKQWPFHSSLIVGQFSYVLALPFLLFKPCHGALLNFLLFKLLIMLLIFFLVEPPYDALEFLATQTPPYVLEFIRSHTPLDVHSLEFFVPPLCHLHIGLHIQLH